MGIVEFNSNSSEIYFPIRLDQGGRRYCRPRFLNYQSNELAKSLFLLAITGIITKDKPESIKYLKV